MTALVYGHLADHLVSVAILFGAVALMLAWPKIGRTFSTSRPHTRVERVCRVVGHEPTDLVDTPLSAEDRSGLRSRRPDLRNGATR